MALGRARPDHAEAPANDVGRDPRFAEVTALAQAGERRALQAVARLAEDVARLGRAIDARLQGADARLAAELDLARGELAGLERMVVRRLSTVEAGQADATVALRAEMASALERLSARLEVSERGAADAAARLGRRLDALAEQARAGESRITEALEARLAEQGAQTGRRIDDLRRELIQREAALEARVEARLRNRSLSVFATGTMLVLVGAAGAVSLTAVALQLLAARTPPTPAGAVRLHLPLRPTLPAELPPLPSFAPEAARPAQPGPRPAGAPVGRREDYAALTRAIGRGDRAALARAQALADGGAPVAQLLLAKLYEGGDAGLPRNLASARRWTERAAQAGERAAMHNLAVYLMTGEGGPPDAPAAARWFEQAAKAGVVDAQFNLGLLYENGRGVTKNLVEAYRWYSIAANAGDGQARARAVALEGRLTRKERIATADQVGGFQPGRAAVQLAVPVIPPAATVAESQKLLAREGRFIGPTDGTDSPAYRAAAAAYLQDHPQARRLTVAP